MSKSQARNWYSHKFLGASTLFIEVEALIQFVLDYTNISNELEIDDSAQPYIYSLAVLGVVRLVVLTSMTYYGVGKLNRTILAKSYNSEIFGSMLTFFSDFIIIQLYLYTTYLYDFCLPIVLLASVVSYVYYKYIRL